MGDDAEIDFFGAHIKVRSAKLAALLNSAVTDDVGVVGKRAIELVGAEPRGAKLHGANLRDADQCDEDLNAALDGDAGAQRQASGGRRGERFPRPDVRPAMGAGPRR